MTEQARTLTVEREFAHPPEKVWRALTNGPLIEDWLMANDFEPKIGRKFQFRMPPVQGWDGVVDCEVLAVEPHERLSYSWNSMGLESTVTYTLTRTASGARLRMEQSGFRPDQERAYQGAQYGWTSFLEKLGGVLDKL